MVPSLCGLGNCRTPSNRPRRLFLGPWALSYRLVLGRSLALAAIGAAIGLAGSAFATRLLGWLLFGANPNDPRMLASAVATLVTVVVASNLPARRAARVEPVIVLRNE